jgi:hypothetical protein
MVLMSFSVQAICPVQKTSIFYINGRDNTQEDAKLSTDRLRQALKRKINPECVTVDVASNHTQGGTTDLLEVKRQESLEEVLTTTNFWEMFERLVPARPAFTRLMAAAFFIAPRAEPDPQDVEILRQINKHLAKYRLESTDNQFIFVGHSAGNYFANFERLAMTQAERNRTKIVSVATLANNVAGAVGPYTTLFQDFYVSNYLGALIPNFPNVGDCGDEWACHGWLTSYMVPGSNSRGKIVDDIIAALPTAPPALIYEAPRIGGFWFRRVSTDESSGWGSLYTPAGNQTVNKVSFYIWREENPGSVLEARIYAENGPLLATSSPVDGNTVIFNPDWLPPSGNEGGWVPFTFGTPVPLVFGNRYVLTVHDVESRNIYPFGTSYGAGFLYESTCVFRQNFPPFSLYECGGIGSPFGRESTNIRIE